jgi:N-acetylmuramoyl-L-alanine amidase
MTLENRANMANRAKDDMPADLLISMHANACMGPVVNGFKVFYAAKRHEFDLDEIIQMEGATVDEGDFMTRRQDLIESARWDGLYRKHGNANKLLASSVATALEKDLSMPKLLVAPAVLRLARGLDMPAALVEIGFLSNSAGETMLSTEDFRDTCALALLEGVRTYLDQRRDPFGELGQARESSTTGTAASVTERSLD